jgi:hypothetical protein
LSDHQVKQVDTVLCRCGRAKEQKRCLFSLRLMASGLGAGVLRNPFVHDNAKFAEWVRVGAIGTGDVMERFMAKGKRLIRNR